METHDGFIIGVHNYCDRWCERCSLSARCHVFAEVVSEELHHLDDTPPGHGQPALLSLGAVASQARPTDDEDDTLDLPPVVAPWAPPQLPAEVRALETRIRDFGRGIAAWRPPEGTASDPAVRDSLEVLGHFGIFIGPKVHRALLGLALADDLGPQSDANGSAKAALLAFDRLGDAWLRLAERGAVGVAEAAPVLNELAWMTGEVERLFPRARQFVRPGFDEPHAVAMLEWQERG
jgi:hypothetical protein